MGETETRVFSFREFFFFFYMGSGMIAFRGQKVFI